MSKKTFRLFFDVDGVVLNFEEKFISFIDRYLDLDIPEEYEPDSLLFEDLLTYPQLVDCWDNFLESSDFIDLKPLIDPCVFNDTFKGYPIHFVTNIPPKYLSDREKNLILAGFVFDSVHCGGLMSFDEKPPITKASVVKGLIRAGESIFFVDDNSDNCIEMYEKYPGSTVLLMKSKHNNGFKHPFIKRVEWRDILKNVESIFMRSLHS